MNSVLYDMRKNKPKYTEPCNHCGLCCATEICAVGKMIVNSHVKPPCPLLLRNDNVFRCPLVITEIESGLKPVVARALGIGCGCSMPDDDTTEEEIDAFDAWSKAHIAALALQAK